MLSGAVGHAIVGALGRVMVADGVRHGGGLGLGAGVMAAHDALQLGKLAHHPGHEVGLGQQRRALGQRPVGPRHMRHQRTGQCHQPFHPLSRASPARHGRPSCPAPAGGSPATPCGPGPRRTWRPTAAPAAPARCRRRWRPRHRWPTLLATMTKRGASCAVPGAQRQVFLVRPHRADEDLGRQRHERGVDRAQQRYRPFDQPLDLVQQRRVVGRHVPCAGGQLVDRPGDDLSALGTVQDHLGVPEPDHIVGEIHDRERLGRHEPVAARRGTSWHPAQLERHHAAVEQAQDRLQRPDPTEVTVAPAHRFRPGQAPDRLRQQFGQQVGHARARAPG